MRTPRVMAATALTLMLLAGGGCAEEGGWTSNGPVPPSPHRTPPDSSNATIARANAAPLSSAPAVPLPRTRLQPSMPAIDAAAQTPAGLSSGVFRAVTVTLSAHAQGLAAADPRLTPEAVAAAVEHELQAHRMLASGSTAPALAITVEDLTSTLASDTVVLGYTFSNVMLSGEVTAAGSAAAVIDVHARARLTSRGAGGSTGSLGPLYRRFAQLLVADLRSIAYRD